MLGNDINSASEFEGGQGDAKEPKAQDQPKEEEVTQEEIARGCCECFSFKCIIITLAILLWLDFFIQCLNAYYVYDNEHFDQIYFQVYVAILVLYLAAVILVSIYLFPADSPETRAFLPWGFLVAAIASLLLVCWIIIYISSIYEDDDVYV